MIFAILGSPSGSVGLTWLVGVAFAACIGGVFVFVGLLMEHRHPDKWYRNVADIKRCKRRAGLGWYVLMLGIFVEIVSAGVFAIRGEVEMRQAAAMIERAKPENQPISSVTAEGTLVFFGTNLESFVKFGQTNLTTFLERDIILGVGDYSYAHSYNPAVMLIADKVEFSPIFSPEGVGTHVRLRFVKRIPQFQVLGVSGDLDKWNVLTLNLNRLRGVRELESGPITVVVNSRSRTYQIPRQFPGKHFSTFGTIFTNGQWIPFSLASDSKATVIPNFEQ